MHEDEDEDEEQGVEEMRAEMMRASDDKMHVQISDA